MNLLNKIRIKIYQFNFQIRYKIKKVTFKKIIRILISLKKIKI
jgi:hypothetical protein